MEDSTSERDQSEAEYPTLEQSMGFPMRGHNAGDLMEAREWLVLENRLGYLKLDVHLPEHLLNPSGQLFGGFTGTYVDFAALHTMRAGLPPIPKRGWMSTVNMRIDYFEPVLGPRFIIESEVINRRERTVLIGTKFLDHAGNMLVHSITTLRVLTSPT